VSCTLEDTACERDAWNHCVARAVATPGLNVR
jgi:hypothetical protein